MLLFTTILHIILCIILILVILLQPGKGADVGAAFGGGGGGSSTIFGPRGAGSFLSKATTMVAVLFMVTSVTLAIYSNEQVREGSDIEDQIRRLQQEDGTSRPTIGPQDGSRDEPAMDPEAPEVEPGRGMLPPGEVPPGDELVPTPAPVSEPLTE